MGTSDARCVYCRQRPVDAAWRPFCGERCKMADLGRWLTGGYSVPAAPDSDDELEADSANGRHTDDH